MDITGEISITSPYSFLKHPKHVLVLVKICVDLLSYCKFWEDECNQKRDEELRMLEQTMNSQSLEKRTKTKSIASSITF